jgi:hypothetical protein
MKKETRDEFTMFLELNQAKLRDQGVDVSIRDDKVYFELRLTTGPMFHQDFCKYLDEELRLGPGAFEELAHEVRMFTARRVIAQAVR